MHKHITRRIAVTACVAALALASLAGCERRQPGQPMELPTPMPKPPVTPTPGPPTSPLPGTGSAGLATPGSVGALAASAAMR